MEQRAAIHIPIIEQYAKANGVHSPLIKAIVTVESCFDPYAVSQVGAKGLMQLMPEIAQLMGVRNVFDANDNRLGGIRYFSGMLKRCGHNVGLALAAYNAGPKALKNTQAYRLMRKRGIM
jgi:soluble lytic murein transglycosylase-like protein